MVSRCLLIREASFLSCGSPCGICGRQVVTGTGFSRSISVFLVNYYAITASIFICKYLASEAWTLGPVAAADLYRHNLNHTEHKQTIGNRPISILLSFYFIL